MKTAQKNSLKKLTSTLTNKTLVARVFMFSAVFSATVAMAPLVWAQAPEAKTTSLETKNEASNEAKPTLMVQPPATNQAPVVNQAKTIDQTQISITAIPPRMGEDNSLTALPGEKIQVQLRVRNLSEQTINLVTSAKDFILAEDGETPIAVDDSTSNRWSLASWLTITPTENTINPKETIGLNVLIEVPEDALPGGHYAMVLHQPKKVSDDLEISGTSESAVNQRVGTLLYVIVEGEINEEAYIRNFEFPGFSEYGPINFGYTVENNSDIHITPQMNVEIFNIFNQKVDNIQISPKNIFPLTSRDFEGQWKRIWGFGPYKAKLTMSFGNNGSVVVANTSFWLLPIKIIIAAVVLLLTLMILILSVKRHLRHRKNMDQKKIEDLENKIQKMNSTQNNQVANSESDQNDTPQL